MKVQDVPELAKLSVKEKLLFVEELWESIGATDSQIPVPQSHVDELEKRYKGYLSEPGSLLTMDQLQAKIEARK